MLKRVFNGFTVSEVILIIGIIGVVAVLTLPTIINETKDREYAAARKRVLATVGEAIRIMAVQGNIRYAEDAKDFVENYLNKQLRIVKTCDNNNLRDCGIETEPNRIFSLKEQKMTMPKTIGELAKGIGKGSVTDASSTSYGFLLQNGYAMNLFYNPNCLSDNESTNRWGQDRVCLNVIYDVNGLASPNQVGKDIGFVTVLYSNLQSVAVAPDVAKSDASPANFTNAPSSCIAYAKDNKNNYNTLPNRDELFSMYYNGNLLGITSKYYWSSFSVTDKTAWTQSFGDGWCDPRNKSNANVVRCIRR